MHPKENQFMLMIHPFLISRNLLLSCTTTNVFAFNKCSVNDMLAIDPNARVEYTINNTDQELEYNVNNVRNETCRTTLFRSCSRAMTEPISVKLHRCHCHHRPGRKG